MEPFKQRNRSQRFKYFSTSLQFFVLLPNHHEKVWIAEKQIYRDVEAGIFWNRTLVSLPCQNITDANQWIWDISLLVSFSRTAALLLCTDSVGNVMTEEDLFVEGKRITRFYCRGCRFPRIDFKGFDVIKDGSRTKLSQTYCADKMMITDLNLKSRTKLELARPLNNAEVKIIRTDAGNLAWLATGTYTVTSF